MDFKVLILGSDANAYYMARCTYEAYHKKAHLIAKDRLAFTKFSNILTIEYHEDLWDETRFIEYVNTYAKENANYKILMFSTNETYSVYIARNKEKFLENIIFPNQSESVLVTLTNKEKFYKTYKHSTLDFPETYYFDTTKSTVIPTMNYPMILKPAMS